MRQSVFVWYSTYMLFKSPLGKFFLSSKRINQNRICWILRDNILNWEKCNLEMSKYFPLKGSRRNYCCESDKKYQTTRIHVEIRYVLITYLSEASFHLQSSSFHIPRTHLEVFLNVKVFLNLNEITSMKWGFTRKTSLPV